MPAGKSLIMGKKAVIKIGSNVLTTSEGELDLNQLRGIVEQISDRIKNHNDQVIIVTSAAITSGKQILGINPSTMPETQAAAAVGQLLLMQEYSRFFSQSGFNVGQLLVTQENFANSKNRENISNTIHALLAQNCIPIINENDSVSTAEITFGDNDLLAALVAKLICSDELCLLSSIDGLFTKHPENHNAALIPHLTEINEELINSTSEKTNSNSRGGMKAKLKAAKLAWESKIPVTIANGRRPHVISDILSGKAVGTKIKH